MKLLTAWVRGEEWLPFTKQCHSTGAALSRNASLLRENSYQTRVIGPTNVHLGSAVGHVVIPFLHLLSRGVAAKVFLTPLLWAGKAVTQGAPFKTLPTASHSNMRKCGMNIYS